MLENEEQLNQLLQAKLDEEDDESRVYYVAMSRARDRLFVSIPIVNEAKKKKLRETGFDIIVLDVDEVN